MSYFDHCKIKNLKVYLNSEVFPYEDFQSDFTKNKMATLYRAYAEFQKSYYGRDNVTPLLTRSDFKKLSPIIVVDMSRQNDDVKTSTVDLRIEIETEEAFPASTSAYCLILHDQIITYNPFNGEVRTEFVIFHTPHNGLGNIAYVAWFASDTVCTLKKSGPSFSSSDSMPSNESYG
uniref:Double jelly roll-like domain-containing protein n=1 Tax=Tanacetum cinerariifolium TaxID=118510 RepID=A0A699SS48_TANCI|nr:hypothetical protein [Tanacetum cinerariifolium]